MLPVLSTMYTLFRSPIAKWIGIAALVTSTLGGAYLFVDSRATARAERACSVVLQESQSQMLHDLLASQEEAHQFHLAEVERGNAISAELSKTQRKLDATKTEYLAYANGIVGNCPDSLRVLMSYPSPNSGGETSQDTTPSTPPDTSNTVAASAIATNITVNRWAFESNYAQCTSLLRWHKEGAINE